MTQIAMPQMSYLELIIFAVGNARIGDYWQRISGGEVQLATARHAAPNRRTSEPFAGKITYSQLTLERDYIPNDSSIAVLRAILTHLRDPGNPENQINIIRVLNNSYTPNDNRTIVTYHRCVPTMVPMLGDGDTTADATIMPTRLAFEFSSATVNINGEEFDLDQQIGGNWGGVAGAGVSAAIAGANGVASLPLEGG